VAAKTLPLPRPGERLLFIRFSSLGDVLLSMRQAKALKDRFPFLEITWMAHSEYEPILRMQPYVDDVLPWDIRKGRGTILSAIGKIRRSGFRWLYSVHRNDRSALVSAFSGIPFRIGGHKNLQFLYDFSLKEVKKEWDIKPVPEEGKFLFVPEEKKVEILDMLGGKGRPVLFCAIGASKRFKRWPAWSWSVFLDEAVSMGLQPVLLGSGREEVDLAGEILLSCSCNHEIVDMVDKLTLDQVCSLAAVSVMALGGDTGPVHMARLAGIPCIGLFTVRDPARYGHRGGNLVPIICDSPYVSYPEEPPLFQPLGTITPSRVILELQKILSK
jgi:heptosyltransferase-1